MSGGGYAVGVDIGGTFTDCAVIGPDGTIRTGKVPTRPDGPGDELLRGDRGGGVAKFGLSLDELSRSAATGSCTARRPARTR